MSGELKKRREKCPVTGRVMFESAAAALETAQKYPESNYRAQKCLMCQHWHLETPEGR